MAIVTISAQPGLRADEIAREVATRLGFELVTQAQVESLYESEFGQSSGIAPRGYADILTCILARLAAQHDFVFCGGGGEYLFPGLAGVLRVGVVAPVSVRAGALMVEQGSEQPAAVAALRQLERGQAEWTRARFRRGSVSKMAFDVTLNSERWEASAMAEAIVAAARALGIDRAGVLSAIAERQLQFEARLRLAKLGISIPSAVSLPARKFAHPSEEIFANLLDFYRIPWEYEPRRFPILWDEQGRVLESVTPDFYLSEFDLYVELTTMKQSLVTKKNRKIKRLRELYPEINVQVFYQKDFENLVFKYGLEKTAELFK